MAPSRFPLAVIALFAAACSSTNSPDPADFSLTGSWSQSAGLSDAVNGDWHAHIGLFALAQTGTTFSGQGQNFGLCHAAGGSYTGPLADSTAYTVTNGKIQGKALQFKTNICSYSGSFLNGNPNRLTGTASCS